MKNVIKDIPFGGNLIELNDPILLEEWKNWNRKFNGNNSLEKLEEGRIIHDKIRNKYGINTLMQIGYLKNDHSKIGINISNIPVEDIVYTPSKEGWIKNDIFATSLTEEEFNK
jgi:hypothetical protein